MLLNFFLMYKNLRMKKEAAIYVHICRITISLKCLLCIQRNRQGSPLWDLHFWRSHALSDQNDHSFQSADKQGKSLSGQTHSPLLTTPNNRSGHFYIYCQPRWSFCRNLTCKTDQSQSRQKLPSFWPMKLILQTQFCQTGECIHRFHRIPKIRLVLKDLKFLRNHYTQVFFNFFYRYAITAWTKNKSKNENQARFHPATLQQYKKSRPKIGDGF